MPRLTKVRESGASQKRHEISITASNGFEISGIFLVSRAKNRFDRRPNDKFFCARFKCFLVNLHRVLEGSDGLVNIVGRMRIADNERRRDNSVAN